MARVGKNAVALLIAQAGTRALNLVLVAWLTRTAGAASLGRYLLAITVEAVALSVVDLGLNTFAVRELSKERLPTEAGEGPAVEELWGTLLGLKLLAALGGMVVLNALIGPLFFPGERRVLIAIVSMALLPDAYNGLATALIKARQRMEVSSGVTLGMRFSSVLLGVLLAWQGYGERAILVAYVLTSWAGSAVLGAVLYAWGVRPRWASLGRAWRAVLSEATPFAITGVVAMLYTRLGLLMLSYWQGDLAAGVYGAVYRLWEALGMIPSSLLDALFPEMSRLGSGEQGLARLRAFYRRGRRLLWVAVATLVVPGLLGAPYVLSLLYGTTADTPVSVLLFRGLLLVFPFTYLYLLNGHVLYAVGQQRRVTAVMVAVTVLGGILNALLISRWSYWGAVGVVWITGAMLFILLQALARRFVLRPDGAFEEEGW
jgi:O-antigen/teichoic acid export membrane protein